jgi:hypothetical protein|tara:strand:+ start:2711 stop:2956 length:246 start_codon:yes stop_codon:yes gene_type:complete
MDTGKFEDQIKLAHQKQDEYLEKYNNLHILFKNEKGMNGHLKEQISILEFAISELNKLNESYIKEIGKLKQKLRIKVDSDI